MVISNSWCAWILIDTSVSSMKASISPQRTTVNVCYFKKALLQIIFCAISVKVRQKMAKT